MSIRGINQLSLSIPAQVISFSENESIRTWLLSVISNEANSSNVAIHFGSAAVIVDSFKSKELNLVLSKGITFCDSRPLQIYLKILHRPKFSVPHTRGTSLFKYIMENQHESMKHFFIAPSLEVVDALRKEYFTPANTYTLAGYYVPPMSENIPAMAADMISKIRNSGANLVWIGIGAPKQILLADILNHHLQITTLTIGGAMEIIAGFRREAPIIFQKMGLEWLYRWKQEPRRLAKRYTLQNMEFLSILVLDCFAKFRSKIFRFAK